MGFKTGIEWADHTHNFWVGCTKISAACDNCYAESWAKRAGTPELWQGERRLTSAKNRAEPRRWDRQAAKAGVRRRVFCASLADVFDNQVPVEWRTDLWALIDSTPSLDWMLLTKRPQNIAKMVPDDWGQGRPNVWLGTTTEDQKAFDQRHKHLQSVPAVVHFLSCEPLLSGINMAEGLAYSWPERHKINWVIGGGESGPHARPTHPLWRSALRDQCAMASCPTAFLWKQNGEFLPTCDDEGQISYGGDTRFGFDLDTPSEAWVYRVGKKQAGRMLDGREHTEFPATA